MRIPAYMETRKTSQRRVHADRGSLASGNRPLRKPYIVDLKSLADRDGDKLSLTELGQRDRHGRSDVANAPVRLEELRVRGGRHGCGNETAAVREWRVLLMTAEVAFAAGESQRLFGRLSAFRIFTKSRKCYQNLTAVEGTAVILRVQRGTSGSTAALYWTLQTNLLRVYTVICKSAVAFLREGPPT